MPRPALVRGLVLAATAAAVAAAPAAGQTSSTAIVVTLTEYRIELSRTVASPGRVVFQVTNKGTIAHDFAVVSAGRGTRTLTPGQRQSFSVTLTRRGVHRFRSRIAAHATLGMQGTLRVGKGKAPPQRSGTTAAPFRLTLVADGPTSLTHVAAPPGDAGRVMLVHGDGLVSLLKDGVVQAEPFLDLRDRVQRGFENGLHAIAFAPDYAESGRFYVCYNDLSANLHLVEYRRSEHGPDVADPASARELLVVVKPTETHNGGMLQFGPDGYLYVAVGDGGSDPPAIPVGGPAQVLADPLGSILRIDPRSEEPYGIPSDNPFRDTDGAKPEIVAYGLRNPWRFWIDAQTNTMLIADVGEKQREEINRLPLDRLGVNYGWPCLEGTIIPDFAPSTCTGAMFTAPIYEYAYSPTSCSIIGGVTVRDVRLPKLAGLYLWTDLCDGVIRAIHPGAATPREIPLKQRVAHPTSFGVDALGRVYVTTLAGQAYRLDPP